MLPKEKKGYIRDSTLREGLHSPNVSLSNSDKKEIFHHLIDLGISNFELVAPGNFNQGLDLLYSLKNFDKVSKSAILPALLNNKEVRLEKLLDAGANHLDILLHISDLRLKKNGFDYNLKSVHNIIEVYRINFHLAKKYGFTSIGIGLGDAFRAETDLLQTVVEKLSYLQPSMFIIYDTVGVALPLQIQALIRNLNSITDIPIHCHFHNDFGLATANSIVALECGATGIDVSIGGLGDRSGNACFEEVVTILEQRLDFETGINLTKLYETSRSILKIFGINDYNHRPIIGNNAFIHSTASHFESILNESPDVYEPFPPELIGHQRYIQIDNSPELASALATWTNRNGMSSTNIETFITKNMGKVISMLELKEALR